MSILAAVLIIAVIVAGVTITLFVGKRTEAGLLVGVVSIVLMLLARPMEIGWDRIFGPTSSATGVTPVATSPVPPTGTSAAASVPPAQNEPDESISPAASSLSASGPSPNFQLQMGKNTYADLDSNETDTSGGRRYEIMFDSLAKLFHRNKSNDPTDTFLSKYRLVDIDDTDASGCSHAGRLLNQGFIASSDLRDHNLCVSTSEGRWAILVLKNIAGSSIFTIEGGTFDVYLSK